MVNNVAFCRYKWGDDVVFYLGKRILHMKLLVTLIITPFGDYIYTLNSSSHFHLCIMELNACGCLSIQRKS
jgi:hypothetical protein